ncbi:4-diphosphocytidyl-2-C-methyl-D-erythritol kinase [bacterium HR36]|nr:4-diphosphocytidyl-2-C-methyl-D-erythritol kinase [bacterium HR36]
MTKKGREGFDSAQALCIVTPAKVNWFLEILGKREDGYHEIITFMVAVGLYDRLTVLSASNADIRLEIKEGERISDAEGKNVKLSAGPDNLVWRAADLLRQETGCNRGAWLILEKHIPIGAGLGGGSSDAAATLLLLNRYWELNLPLSELECLAARLGSDVPFFLNGAAAWCRGRGELVTPWPIDKSWWLVLLVPAWPVSTARVYARVSVPAVARQPESFADALRQGDEHVLRQAIFNRLEEPARLAYPGLREVYDFAYEAGLAPVHLSGSGATFFALFASLNRAEEAKAKAEELRVRRGIENLRLYVVRTLTTLEVAECHNPQELANGDVRRVAE